ncbi:MAG: hypothetical protein RL461_671 [Planctomycetota bacterium]|jgi:hypothetical protein
MTARGASLLAGSPSRNDSCSEPGAAKAPRRAWHGVTMCEVRRFGLCKSGCRATCRVCSACCLRLKGLSMRIAILNLIFVSGLMLLGGCAMPRADLVSSGDVTIESAVTRPLAHTPTAENADGDLLVSGQLEEAEAVAGGHLDITVTSPAGVVVHDAIVNYGRASSPYTTQFGPRGASRRVQTGPKHAKYSVRFPGLPPVGSKIRVRLESGAHERPATPR